MHLLSKLFLLYITILLAPQFTYPNEIDALLEEFNKKNNSSVSTININRGHLISYSREKIEKMRAVSLRDILKTTPAIYYHENRYGIPDPLAGGSSIPNVSNFVRIFIDNVEVTQGWIGSGIVLYGDISLDFVDHIDLYYMAPSLDTSAESAYMTIFLYSKDPAQDGGIKTSLIYGSNECNTQSISYGAEKETYAYMLNVSHTNAKRNTIANDSSKPLSRDFERTQIFGYVKDEKQTFHLQLISKQTDSLASLSWDATPDKSQVDYLNLHMDYSIKFTPNWHAQFTYEWLKNDIDFRDDHPLMSGAIVYPFHDFISTSEYSTYTGELTYQNTIGKHHILTGIKSRKKVLDSYSIQAIPDFKSFYDSETIHTLFFQDQYALTEHGLLSLGLSCSKLNRNNGVKDDTLYQARLGYLYTDNQWTYKTYLYRSMYARDTLVASLYAADTSIQPQTSYGISQEITYKTEQYSVGLTMLYMEDKDSLLNVEVDQDTQYLYSLFRYNYQWSPDTQLDLWVYYAKYENLFHFPELTDMSAYLSASHAQGDFDIFNSLVWHTNSIDKQNYFDLTSAITWNINKDLSLTIKGENLLDKAKKSTLFRMDPESMTPMPSLKIPVTDRRVTLNLEYTF
jgi:iron complex outermembrane receptor protein